jgi:hypothetical protein
MAIQVADRLALPPGQILIPRLSPLEILVLLVGVPRILLAWPL